MNKNIEVLRGLEKEWQEYVDKHDGGYSHVEGVKKCLSELRAALAAMGGQEEEEALLTNPHTGAPRDYRDVESDPAGVLIHKTGEPLRAAPHQPEARVGGEVDVTGFGTPPLMHAERADAEKAYSLTAFDYAAAPIGSRDWTIYWRGWWHRSLIYGATTPPPSAVPAGWKLVPVEATEKMREAGNNAIEKCNTEPGRFLCDRAFYAYAAMLAAAPEPGEG